MQTLSIEWWRPSEPDWPLDTMAAAVRIHIPNEAAARLIFDSLEKMLRALGRVADVEARLVQTLQMPEPKEG